MASLKDGTVFDSGKVLAPVKKSKQFNLKNLRLSLKYRPKILNFILKMRHCIRNKNRDLKKLKRRLKDLESKTMEKKDSYSQTDSEVSSIVANGDTLCVDNKLNKDSHSCGVSEQKTETILHKQEESGWDISKDTETSKSIADQVKEVVQSAMQESGMVYVESAGMYYDYKTGYYYNPELGLYYHTDTGCYYYYSDEKKNFVFHSYPDRSAVAANAAFAAHEKKKAKKHKKGKEEDGTQESQAKRQKTEKKKKTKKATASDKKTQIDSDNQPISDTGEEKEKVGDIIDSDNKEKEDIERKEIKLEDTKESLEDGECSESDSAASDVADVEENSETSTSTADSDDDDAVAKHHPPCMRVIVKETTLAKLKVGSLYLVTKDGGTIGREGEQHAILLRDHNVSRNHLDIRYDVAGRTYLAMDLGSKNGTILNGTRMSESQVVSKPMEVIHGSILQLGETKLLCHIHPGKDTCGHCEPGLLMETQEEKKVAYTRTCSVQKQHQLELARLKNKYAPQPKAIEETAYNDRAHARRTTVGSSHHAEKTQSTDVDTFIAPENKGFKLLEKMGWSKGEGLGKDSQGDTEPIPMVNNEGKAGLGAAGVPAPVNKANTLGQATMRLASRTKILKPPAKAFQNDDPDDDIEEEE